MLKCTPTLKTMQDLKPATITWAEQLEELASLWNDGVPTEEIAERLGRSASAVLTQAVRIGLPRRASSGRKSSAQAGQAAPKTKMPVNVVVFPVRGYSGAAVQASHAPVRQARNCLMCGTSFASHGSHNRICTKCKDTQAYQNGYDPNYSIRSA